ncbi:hypothetical protein DVH05_009903 [Phytophthora capsici]|nr:hypothetical protein DVH05_009903 [Phytophthora capsici]
MVARRPLSEMDTFYRRAQLSAGLVNAARRGEVELVQWLLGNIVTERFTVDNHSGIFKAAEVAAANGHLHILEQVLVYDKQGVCIEPAILSAARGNCLSTMKWLSKRLVSPANLQDCANSLLEAAARNGNTEVASWIVEMVGVDCLRESVASAAQRAISGGHLEMINSLVDIASSLDGPFFLDEAAGQGYIEALEWGLEHGGVCTTAAMDAAASNGHLEVVRWLHRHRTDGCTKRALDDAASYGHLEVVRWLHYNRTEGCSIKAMDGAATHGHLDVVKWLHRHRNEGCTTAAMNGAATGNHIDVVQWLHDHRLEGCSQEAVDGAASNGNVAGIQWLVANCSGSCSLSHSVLENAATNGHLNALQWIYKQHIGSSVSEWIASGAMDRAANCGHLDVVKWLHERHPGPGNCTTAALDGAATNGHLEVVKWLHVNRSEGGTYRAMDGAATGGHLEVMMFLYSHRSDGCTSDAAVNAAANDHVEVVQWLLQHYPQQASHEKVRKFATRYNFSLLHQFNSPGVY